MQFSWTWLRGQPWARPHPTLEEELPLPSHPSLARRLKLVPLVPPPSNGAPACAKNSGATVAEVRLLQPPQAPDRGHLDMSRVPSWSSLVGFIRTYTNKPIGTQNQPPVPSETEFCSTCLLPLLLSIHPSHRICSLLRVEVQSNLKPQNFGATPARRTDNQDVMSKTAYALISQIDV